MVLVLAAHKHVDAPEVAANVTMLQQFFGIENVLGIYWTLQIELIFYALCIGLFIIGLLQKTKFIFWAPRTIRRITLQFDRPQSNARDRP